MGPGPSQFDGQDDFHPELSPDPFAPAASVEAQEHRNELVAENVLGPQWRERVANVQGWAGEKVIAAIEEAGFASDPDCLSQLADLAESDKSGLLRETIRQFLVNGIYGPAANLELARRQADPAFMSSYCDDCDPAHELNKLEMRALELVAGMPPWLEATMKVYAK